MKLGLLAAAVLGAVALAPAAFAAPSLIFCNSCTPLQQLQKAKAAGVGQFYILDLNTNALAAVNVYLSSGPALAKDGTLTSRVSGDAAEAAANAAVTPNQVVVESIPVVSPYKDAAQEIGRYYNVSPRGWDKFEYWNDPIDESVYDIIDVGPKQNNLRNRLLGSDYMRVLNAGAFINAVGAFTKVADISAVPSLTIRIMFKDGSYIDVDVNVRNSNSEATFKQKSAEDSHGNPVPYRRQDDTDGIWRYDFTGPGNPQDMQNFLHKMNELHYVFMPSGKDNSTFHGWVCVQAGEGKDAVYSCQKQ